MALPQSVLVPLLFIWSRPWHATILLALLVGQFVLMRTFLRDPAGRAEWYNRTGVGLYVAGMMVTAFAVRGVMP